MYFRRAAFPVFVPFSTLTREDQISYNNAFSLFSIANLWKVGIQYDKCNTSQESQDSNPNSVTAGPVALIEHAIGLFLGFWVSVAFRCNGCKHHNGEQLQREDMQG